MAAQQGHFSRGDVVATPLYLALAVAGLFLGDAGGYFDRLARALTTLGEGPTWTMVAAFVFSFATTAACGWAFVNATLRVPSLLVACAALPSAVAVTVASLWVAPDAYELAAGASLLDAQVAAHAQALFGAATACAIGLWSSAACFVVAALALGFAGRRRRVGPLRSRAARLAIGVAGLVLVSVGLSLWGPPVSGARHWLLLLVPTSLALLGSYVGREPHRPTDLAAAGCAVAATLCGTFALGLDFGDSGGLLPIEWLHRIDALHAEQRTMVLGGAAYSAVAVAVTLVTAMNNSRDARRHAQRILGYGLLLVATSAAASAVLMPDLREAVRLGWKRHLPPQMTPAPLSLSLESCHELRPDDILFVGGETLWLGRSSLGLSERLDQAAGCSAIASELPSAPTIAVTAEVPSARLLCLLQALAVRTCSVRWLGSHLEHHGTPVCVPTTLVGDGCSTPAAGAFALLDGERRWLLQGGDRSTPDLATIVRALSPETAGMLTATQRTAFGRVLEVAARAHGHDGVSTTRAAPVRLALAERPALEALSPERALPFRSVVEVSLSPSFPAVSAWVKSRSDQLRRCYQAPVGWPPALVRAAHVVLPTDEGARLWRTHFEPHPGAAACAARALRQWPAGGAKEARGVTGPSLLEVTIQTRLPRVELSPFGELGPRARPALDRLLEHLYESRSELDRCYHDALERDPALEASFFLRLVPDERGYVGVPFIPPEAPSDVALCMTNLLRQQHWPDPALESLGLTVQLVLPH